MAVTVSEGMAPVRDPWTPGQRRLFLVLLPAYMASSAMSVDVMLPAFPDIRREYGVAADSTLPSRLLTVFFLGLAIGQLFYGPLSDRFGRRPLLLTGLALYVGGALASAVAPSFGVLLACRVVWGLGAAGPRSIVIAMIRDRYHGDVMARVMSRMMTIFLIVPILAPPFGAALMTFLPWQVVIWMPVLSGGALIFGTLALPESLPRHQRRSIAPAALGSALRTVLTTRLTLMCLLVLTFVFGMATSLIGSFQIIMEDVFHHEELFSVFFALLAAAGAAASLFAGRIVARIGLRRLMRLLAVWFIVTASIMMLITAATGGHPPMWAFIAAVVPMFMGVTPMLSSCNSAAMAPLGHVAGMGAAVLGTVSTGLGATLGSFVDGAFNGTVVPTVVGITMYATLASSIVILATRDPGVRALGDNWDADEPVALA
jgi:DHA1 family bicyclomycin/chloramphenicol resistance-like MFS transporter